MADTPPKFNRMDLDQFLDVLGQFPFRRRINAVHMHHTFRPNHAQYRRDPEGAIIGMWRFHTKERGFSTIAQHITIGPDGEIWSGRHWDLAPASATGHNGNSVAGPFMFETIGDFDIGGDTFGGAQRESALAVIAHVQRRFALPPETLHFHNQMSTKSCPGTQIALRDVLDAVRQLHASFGAIRGIDSVFGPQADPRRLATRTIIDMLGAPPNGGGRALDEGELTEDEMDADETRAMSLGAPEDLLSTRAAGARASGLTADEKERLRSHLVNLRFGVFSTTGNFATTPADVERIFNQDLPAALDAAKQENRKLKLLFFAHGGLVDENAGLKIALDQLDFWTKNKVYPIFFVWETGLLESLADILRRAAPGTRGFISDAFDKFLEAVARPAGAALWGQMKRSAETSVLEGGGALFVAERAGKFCKANRDHLEIYAAGHSAGSIFHSHFIPALLKEGAESISNLFFLAPAVNVPTFKKNLMPHVGGAVKNMTMFTMKRSFEEDDTAGPYRKSLLYFVHHSFEEPDETPILGLEEHVRADPDLVSLFGLGGAAGRAEIVFSVTPDSASKRAASRSTTHGGFDNDAPTMNSVARRMLNVADEVAIADYPRRTSDDTKRGFDEMARALEPAVAAAEVALAAGSPVAAFGAPAVAAVATGTGRKRALCVGINAYPPPNGLNGCVTDAGNWASCLRTLGFETASLLDGHATREAILSRLSDLVRTSRAGDIVVFQYAGHGTTLKDVDGDEDDANDEALCPVDMEAGGFIIDDNLRGVFAGIPDGVNVTCFMDCCHSGTITRMFAGLSEANAASGRSTPRFIKATADMQAAHQAFRASVRAKPPRLIGPEDMKEVVFSACLPSEVAFETDGNGDFTSRVVPILAGGLGGLTHEVFQQRITASFKAPARQHPNLDCAPGAGARVLFRALA